jgi:very-short-patch-repair endonuclease
MGNKARSLRKQPTDAERFLREHLRNRRLAGCKFRRQEPIGQYVVDFVCVPPRLVIEVDGGQHSGQVDYDAKRTAYLESLGYRVVRFWNNKVLGDIDSVLEHIPEIVSKNPSPRPSPGGRGGNAAAPDCRAPLPGEGGV